MKKPKKLLTLGTSFRRKKKVLKNTMLLILIMENQSNQNCDLTTWGGCVDREQGCGADGEG